MWCTRSLRRNVWALVFCLAVARLAGAASVEEVRGRIAELKRSGTVTLAAQEPILQAFEAWAKQFYALVDRGDEAGARALFQQIHGPMKDLYEHNRGRTEALVQGTIRADGNLEAAQDSPEFRDAEIARLRTLYHLNWVSYLGATFLPEGSRKPYLEFAVEGFGEFVVGPDPAIAREALFGRAQAHKGLGEWDEALADLRRLIELGPSSPHYAQSRTSVVEVLLGAKRADQAAREANALIADAAAGSLGPTAAANGRLLRAQALFLSVKQGGGNRSAAVREALSLLRAVEREGGSWKRKAQAVASWGLEGLPEADLAAGSGMASITVAESLMLKGKHAEALSNLEAAIGNPSTPPEERTAARFYAGMAAFQVERFPAAAKHLRAFLEAAPKGPDAPEASYLLFKSLEQVARTDQSPETQALFRQALRAFVEGYPAHQANAEGRFRLAEILRDDGDVPAAVAEFRKVRGNRTLELYAEFNAAQAMFGRLRNPPQGVAPADLERERTETVTALERLIGRLGAGKEDASVPAEELGAKASIMAAILASEGTAPDYPKTLELTRDFAKRFPGRPELARQAFAIEVLALRKTADPARAEQAISSYLDAMAVEERARRKLMKQLGREFFVQAESERAAGRAEVAAASARIAIAIYGRLLAELEPDAFNADARRGLHATLGKLHASVGEDAEAAAAFTNVLEIDPKSEEALRGLAEIATRSGEHDKARRYWHTLSELLGPKDPDWLDARLAAATSAAAAGNVQAGCQIVRESEALTPYPFVRGDRARVGAMEKKLCGG